jgi:hypothetical protein
VKRLAVACILIGIALSTVPLLAATTEDASSGLDGGVYIAADAEPVDAARLRSLVVEAAAADLALSVVVLGDSATDAVVFAESVADSVGGTVIVFTPAAYGVFSADLAQDNLDDALNEAADALSGPNAADGVAAFVEALQPTSVNWARLFGVGVLILIVVGVAGRTFERRATAQRRDRALKRRWSELRTRTDALADPILDLETRVGLDGREDLSIRYRSAANHFANIHRRVDGPPSAPDVVELERELAGIEGVLDALERDLTTP